MNRLIVVMAMTGVCACGSPSKATRSAAPGVEQTRPTETSQSGETSGDSGDSTVEKTCHMFVTLLDGVAADDPLAEVVSGEETPLATCTRIVEPLSMDQRLEIRKCAGSCGDAEEAISCYTDYGTEAWQGVACGEDFEDAEDSGGDEP